MNLVVGGLLMGWGCGSGVRDFLLDHFFEIKICEGNFGKAISFLKIRNYMTDKNADGERIK